MVRQFKGKTVVITGAAGGMDLAFAQRFGRAGGRIAMLNIRTRAVVAAAG
jgi:NAD(P)-dependent dehydrogenase (short-subunit alcohol dehydrogenase family)